MNDPRSVARNRYFGPGVTALALASWMAGTGCGVVGGRNPEDGHGEPTLAKYVVNVFPSSHSFGPIDDSTTGELRQVFLVKAFCTGNEVPEGCNVFRPGWVVKPIPANLVNTHVFSDAAETQLEMRMDAQAALVWGRRWARGSLVTTRTAWIQLRPEKAPPRLELPYWTDIPIAVIMVTAKPERAQSVPNGPKLGVSPGQLRMNQYSSGRVVRIRNTGRQPLQIEAVDLSGADSNFAELFMSPLPWRVNPGCSEEFIIGIRWDQVLDQGLHLVHVVVRSTDGQQALVSASFQKS